ncbi:MAG TPA: hypothetical protein PLO53_14615, partial [Candidatus Hydrogenedentes bacterium]|nr:hypothetical protein [Candidatus Hydrogenedentota bacterium]
MDIRINMAVEGIVDEAVAKRLLATVGVSPGLIIGKRGKDYLLKKLHGLNSSARSFPWLVLVDQDRDPDCPPALIAKWCPNPNPWLCLRVVVRAVEAWLIADADGLADYLGISTARIPFQPELLSHPKTDIVHLARLSPKKEIRTDMIPAPHPDSPKVGPAYSSRVIEFVLNYWDIDNASKRAPGLARTLRKLRVLKNK